MKATDWKPIQNCIFSEVFLLHIYCILFFVEYITFLKAFKTDFSVICGTFINDYILFDCHVCIRVEKSILSVFIQTTIVNIQDQSKTWSHALFYHLYYLSFDARSLFMIIDFRSIQYHEPKIDFHVDFVAWSINVFYYNL